MLQFGSSFRDSLPAHAKCSCYQFLGDGQLTPGDAVKGCQQPARKLLFHRMVPVAGCDLGHLCQQCLGVAQQQTLQAAGAVEFLLQQVACQAVGVARRLHHGRA